jgi:tetratricopeptide (TPR) repeat protein
VLYEQGKLDAAIAMYHKALTIEPSFPEAYNNLGNALREAGRYDEAIACYSACIQLQYSKAVQAVQLQQFGCPGDATAAAAAASGAVAAAAAAAAAGGGGVNLLSGLAAMAASRPPQVCLCVLVHVRKQRVVVVPEAAEGQQESAHTHLTLEPLLPPHSCSHRRPFPPHAQALLPPGVAARVGVAYNNLGGILKMTGQALAAIGCYEQVCLFVCL